MTMRIILHCALILLVPCLSHALPRQASSANTTVNNPSSDSAAALSRAKSLIDANKNDEGIRLLQPQAGRDPEPAGVEAALGKAYYQERNLREAVAHLEVALKQDANDAESTQLLGLSYSLTGHASEAIPLLEKVQSALPHPDPSGFYALGICYLAAGRFDQARATFAKMFSVPPESAHAHLVLAQMMMHQNLEDQAAPELQRALAADPKLPMAHFLLGEVDLYRGRTADALTEFKAELSVNPISWLAY
jgi:tetratricopeptide (TPR) repeat protein